MRRSSFDLPPSVARVVAGVAVFAALVGGVALARSTSGSTADGDDTPVLVVQHVPGASAGTPIEGLPSVFVDDGSRTALRLDPDAADGARVAFSVETADGTYTITDGSLQSGDLERTLSFSGTAHLDTATTFSPYRWLFTLGLDERLSEPALEPIVVKAHFTINRADRTAVGQLTTDSAVHELRSVRTTYDAHVALDQLVAFTMSGDADAGYDLLAQPFAKAFDRAGFARLMAESPESPLGEVGKPLAPPEYAFSEELGRDVAGAVLQFTRSDGPDSYYEIVLVFEDRWRVISGTAVVCREREPTIIGSINDDVIEGTEGDDVIVAFGGDDVIHGRGGDDAICAGDGDDEVDGGAGDDWIEGGPGDDRLVGSDNDDTIIGGPGDDSMSGGPGADRVWADEGNDHADGGPGDDNLSGVAGENVLLGGDGDDVLGGSGFDPDAMPLNTCDGGPGDDRSIGCVTTADGTALPTPRCMVAADGTLMLGGGASIGGRIALFTGGGEGPVAILSPDCQQAIRLADVGGSYDALAWSPDGSRVAYARRDDGNTDIFIAATDGSGEMRLTTQDGEDTNPSWSPDGTQIVYESTRRSFDIWVINADGTNDRPLFRDETLTGRALMPAWSPHGSTIALTLFESDLRVYLFDLDGTELAEVGPGMAPVWSPDGSQLAFLGSDGAVQVANADGSDARPVTSGPHPRGIVWSPDGSRIAYYSQGNNKHVFVVDADGANQRQLTFDEAHDYHPTWSPDGEWLAFVSVRSGNEDIYLVRYDGTELSRLTDSRGRDYEPRWVP